MGDAEMDEILSRSAQSVRYAASSGASTATMDRILESIDSDMKPVKVLSPRWTRVSVLVIGYAALAMMLANAVGFDGLHALGPWRGGLILTFLIAVSVILARQCVALWVPGSRLRVRTYPAIAGSYLGLISLFVLEFSDLHVDHFVANGVACLEQGLLHALPAAIVGAWVLRRGVPTRPLHAGIAAGALASLTGLGFLELHCPNPEVLHVVVWHAAVLPVGALAGAVVAKGLQRGRA